MKEEDSMTLQGSNEDWLESLNKNPNTSSEVKTLTTVRLKHSQFNNISRLAESEDLSKAEIIRRLIDKGFREVKEEPEVASRNE